MPVTTVYEELIDFIAGGNSREAVAAFMPSEQARERAWSLLDREKSGEITPEESDELKHYVELEHILRMAKARARTMNRHELR